MNYQVQENYLTIFLPSELDTTMRKKSAGSRIV